MIYKVKYFIFRISRKNILRSEKQVLGYLGLILFVLFIFIYIFAFYMPSLIPVIGVLLVIDIVLILALVIKERIIDKREEDEDDYSKY